MGASRPVYSEPRPPLVITSCAPFIGASEGRRCRARDTSQWISILPNGHTGAGGDDVEGDDEVAILLPLLTRIGKPAEAGEEEPADVGRSQ
jgi:hypothetical protein